MFSIDMVNFSQKFSILSKELNKEEGSTLFVSPLCPMNIANFKQKVLVKRVFYVVLKSFVEIYRPLTNKQVIHHKSHNCH